LCAGIVEGHHNLDPQSVGDLWSLDPQSKVWTEIEISGTWPEARSWHGWTGAGSTLYLLGGGSEYSGGDSGYTEEAKEDMWAFSTTTSTWAQLASGPSHTYFSLGASGGLIYILGGAWADVTGYFWSYDPEENAWTERTDSVTVEGSNPLRYRYGGALLDVAGELLLVQEQPDYPGIAPMLPSLLHER
jgi:hypothetical protein